MSGPDPVQLHAQGVEALVGKRLARARSLLTRARDEASDARLAARAETSLAFLEGELGNTDEGCLLYTSDAADE